MKERTAFNPKQLTSARISRGMTMKELAERAGLSRQMISNYESGKTIPKAESLLKILSVLNFPRSFFSNEVSEFTTGATFFRSQTASTKRVRDMQKERLKYLFDIYGKLSSYVNFPKLNLPDILEKDIYDITEDDIIKKANELRKKWELDLSSPINNLIQVAEKNGIVIAEANMSNQTLDAVSRWIVDRPFIMLTDNSESAVRRRFNVAHELGHILLHNSIESIHDYSAQDLKNVIEMQANLFASHFLLPSQAFTDSLLSTSLDYYVDLKKYWKVSIQAMIYKTYSLNLINDDQRLYLNKRISANKWRTKEPYDDAMPIEKPKLLKMVIEMIVNNNVISKNELFQLFKLPKDEVEKVTGYNFSYENSQKEIPNLRLLS
ncbi:helix-turn-helix domain-containing protein [Enterococcus villorum]|uniref:Transcriptional regulator n=2 Tax=Enterococcus villorum TaxID=112904 RepID=A0A511IZG5_9ENTE|nr:XRE family transcriptional regulator [Enterococcus villorum]EOH89272.1 zinc-binding Cro/CI family transcriptional regulator [Enterococcus villorum ATCC 700913]EOW76080.1 zinc-binding Cro/CI family transcriptional regulator [Enterococcus villorum ATCC 700913]GEL91134.1 transcriptional regulator [Enterococcus villorum]